MAQKEIQESDDLQDLEEVAEHVAMSGYIARNVPVPIGAWVLVVGVDVARTA